MWSAVPGTTNPSFPFGVFTLASTEGRCGDGAFRQAQTLNYGVLPSPDLPNTFVAQGFDAQDPGESRAHRQSTALEWPLYLCLCLCMCLSLSLCILFRPPPLAHPLGLLLIADRRLCPMV